MTSNEWPPFVRVIEPIEVRELLGDWEWLVHPALTPLFVTMLGDWIFGAPDGALWALSMLEGDLRQLAPTGAEYNRLKSDSRWLDKELQLGWYEIALREGLVPSQSQCVGWKVAPVLGGKFEKANLQLYSMRVYQAVTGQMFRQIRAAR